MRVDDVAPNIRLWLSTHGYTMWRMTWRAPIHYVVDDAASNIYPAPAAGNCHSGVGQLPTDAARKPEAHTAVRRVR